MIAKHLRLASDRLDLLQDAAILPLRDKVVVLTDLIAELPATTVQLAVDQVQRDRETAAMSDDQVALAWFARWVERPNSRALVQGLLESTHPDDEQPLNTQQRPQDDVLGPLLSPVHCGTAAGRLRPSTRPWRASPPSESHRQPRDHG